MPFRQEAEVTLCNQTHLQNKGKVRVKLFETSSSKSRCLRSCCSLAYVMACDSLRTVAPRRIPKGRRSTIMSQICFQRACDDQVASNAKADVRSRHPPLLSSCIEKPTGQPDPESNRQKSHSQGLPRTAFSVRILSDMVYSPSIIQYYPMA